MKIQIDGVAYEFVLRASAATFYDPKLLPEFDQADEDAKEFALMATLELGVIMGAVSHRFDARRKLDIFQSTSRLIRHWAWVFPGERLNADCKETRFIKLSGRRSRHITKDWAIPNPNDSPPTWPS